MIKIYISGQISGLIRDDAQKNFDCAERYLRSLGFKVLNPMKLNPYNPDWSWQQYMLEDIRELFECDAIFLLDNWVNSRGARIELNIAHEMGMQIFSLGKSGTKSYLIQNYLNHKAQLVNSVRLLDFSEIIECINSHQRTKFQNMGVIEDVSKTHS